MSTATLSTFAETIGDYVNGAPFVRAYIHADESRTFIYYEEEPSLFHPREEAFTLANLVVQHRGYVDLDEADSGIEEAIERFGDVEDPRVARYVSMFRPDIAYFEPRWEVQGSSQSDWSYGYGYVLRSDFEEAFTGGRVWSRYDITPREVFEGELAVYQEWFEGNVYYAIHVEQGKPCFEIGEAGGYLTGDHEALEESCGGFLGYGNLEDIAEDMSGSPIVGEEWSW